jgi:alpha-ribazole phosphatase
MPIWLVRHAEADWPDGLALGRRDVGLSSRGWESARGLGERFRSHHLQAVVASDLRRALDTAWCIAAPHGLRVQEWLELREIDFGTWEGRHLADLWTEGPGAARRWEADARALPPGFGETFGAFEARIRRAMDRLLCIESGNTVVVAHGGSLRLLLALLTDSPLGQAWRDPFPPAAVRAVQLASGLATRKP